jgi:Sel1 repeat
MNNLLATNYELIRRNCHNCGTRHRFTPASAGKQFRCRNCGMRLTVPIPAQDKQPSPPPKQRAPIWPWAIGAVVIIGLNIASLGPAPPAEATEEAAIEIPEPEPEAEPEQPPAAIDVAESAPAILDAKETGRPAVSDAIPQNDAAEEAYKLGLCYETGDGVEQSPEDAAAYYEEAANAGHAEAMYKIGLCYIIGKGVDKDEETGKEWLNESVAAGHPDAKLALEYLESGFLPLAYTAWMTRPLGEGMRKTDRDAAAKEHLGGLTPQEYVDRQMAFANRLLGGRDAAYRSVFEPDRNFKSAADARQRDRFVRGMRKSLPNGIRPR